MGCSEVLVLVLALCAVWLHMRHRKLSSSMGASGPLSVRVYTHNVRYATAAPFTGEEAWPVRAPRSIAEARYHTRGIPAALICLQEVLHTQLTDFITGLNPHRDSGSSAESEPEWAYVGVGRDDGRHAGEYSPIFYRPAVYELKGYETIWLSPTPTVPSKGWGAGSVRILTVAVLAHRETGKTILALNTHLDDRSSLARQKGAEIILATIAKYLQQEKVADPEVAQWIPKLSKNSNAYPIQAVVLAGDLNSEAHQEAYQTLTSARSPLLDVHGLVSPSERYGNEDTYTGFTERDVKSRIDYILAGPRHLSDMGHQAGHDEEKGGGSPGTAGPWKVEGYAGLSNLFDDQVYNSDHRAVVVDLEL